MKTLTIDQVKPIANDLSEPSHTPGPWFNQGIYIMARNPKAPLPNAQTIGRAFPDHSTVGGDTLANAVLMAAAPELLAFAEMIANGGLDAGENHAVIEAEARKVIAKAKGEIYTPVF